MAVFLDKYKMMDNVQKHKICITIFFILWWPRCSRVVFRAYVRSLFVPSLHGVHPACIWCCRLPLCVDVINFISSNIAVTCEVNKWKFYTVEQFRHS
jgi:hypothetical protein